MGCSSSGPKDDDPPITPIDPPTPICEPSIKIMPQNKVTPYMGFTNGNNATKYKVEFTNKCGKKSLLDSDYYLLRWSTSDKSIVDPNQDKWFISNGKATITCTYSDYSANYTIKKQVKQLRYQDMVITISIMNNIGYSLNTSQSYY